MSRFIPYLSDEAIERDAAVLLAEYSHARGVTIEPPIPIEDIVIDPLVMTVGADHNASMITFRTIELVRKEFGVNINLGASNVSFGLPERDVINQAFLALAMSAGASCAITDPMKYGLTIKAIDLLRARDDYGMKYLKYFRAHPPVAVQASAPAKT